MSRLTILDEAAAIVSGERQSIYGPPEDNFARIARLWTAHLQNRGLLAAGRETVSPLDVAAMMRFVKEARLCASPGHRDSYVDLVGYAACGARLAGVEPARKEP